MLEADTVVQGRYRILDQIAKGGMGIVYLARDENLSVTVAVKQNFFDDPHLIEAFKREARLLANLRHPSLPQVKDYFINEVGQFLVRKHTIDMPPGSRRSYRVTADALGRWAYHCHLLYHMEMGMFRTVIPAYIVADLIFALAFAFLFVKVGTALGGGVLAGIKLGLIVVVFSADIGALYDYYGVTYMPGALELTSVIFQVIAHAVEGAVAGFVYKTRMLASAVPARA